MLPPLRRPIMRVRQVLFPLLPEKFSGKTREAQHESRKEGEPYSRSPYDAR